MNTLAERIQTIRIGKGAPSKINAYLKTIDDAMKDELTLGELQKIEGILSRVDIGFTLQSKPKKSSGKTKAKRDAKAPRKVTFSAYGLFLQKTIADLKEQKFTGNNFMQCSVIWRTKSVEEKKEWEEKARAANIAASKTDADIEQKVSTKVTQKVDLTGDVGESDVDPESEPELESDTESIGSGESESAFYENTGATTTATTITTNMHEID